MIKSISRPRLIAAWCATLAVVTALNVAYGMRPSFIAFFLAVGLAPAVILLLIGGQPSPTVAEVLRAADAPDARR
jgi:hypothetical protein